MWSLMENISRELRESAGHECCTFKCRVMRGNRRLESAQLAIRFIGFRICSVHCNFSVVLSSSSTQVLQSAQVHVCRHGDECAVLGAAGGVCAADHSALDVRSRAAVPRRARASRSPRARGRPAHRTRARCAIAIAIECTSASLQAIRSVALSYDETLVPLSPVALCSRCAQA